MVLCEHLDKDSIVNGSILSLIIDKHKGEARARQIAAGLTLGTASPEVNTLKSAVSVQDPPSS